MRTESHVVRGGSPVLVVAPHAGCAVPIDLRAHPAWEPISGRQSDPGGMALTEVAQTRGMTGIAAAIHPCVIDMNVAPHDSALSERLNRLNLCRTHTAHGEALYSQGLEPDGAAVKQRVADHWTPFHESVLAELLRLREAHANVFMLVAHAGAWLSPFRSQRATVDCHFSTSNGNSCDRRIVSALTQVARHRERAWVVNGKSAEGFAARHYGRPESGIHVVELEISGNWRREIELARNEGKGIDTHEAAMSELLDAAERTLSTLDGPTTPADLPRALRDAFQYHATS
ncbi:N-formylglutamate amidohydrolase [Caballeronia calidae]|uniref:N-formylglutamate amidohydrolase n=1 Tax=Caballeronia calidae TaxID=1777139 RepID=A0A158CUA5_9BURK|nr:N-formylglutamate amidohydrolase [Caballeronia calidae]SAK85935.1 N-formylglutamate amidohydrolase [Caballeronia calidae]